MSQTLQLDQFYLIAQGHAAFQLLWAGTQFNLFSKLHEKDGMTINEIQEAIGTQFQPTRILVVGLTALGLLEKKNDRYYNSEIADNLLRKEAPGNLLAVLGWQHHIVYPGLIDFVESLKTHKNAGLERFPGTENTLYERLAHTPAIEKVFQDAMSSLSTHSNKLLLDAISLEGVKHIVDVGGGDATNTIAFAQKFDQLKLTVFDSESVCIIAEKNIEKAGLSHRINTHVGNLFDTEFPTGIDAILYSHMFTIYSPEKNIEILRKTYQALPTNGIVIIFNMMGNDNDDGPISTALGSPYFLAIATGEGMLYSWSDYEKWLAEAGFKAVKRGNLESLNHGYFIGTK